MCAIKKIVSIHITSAGCYFEDHPHGLVQPDAQLLLEEANIYLLSYWSTISGTNSPRAGPAAAMVNVGDQENRHIVQKINRQNFRKGTAPLHFELRGWLMNLCCRTRVELS